jgi:hypothetical protein
MNPLPSSNTQMPPKLYNHPVVQQFFRHLIHEGPPDQLQPVPRVQGRGRGRGQGSASSRGRGRNANRRTLAPTDVNIEPPPKRKRGRPRKNVSVSNENLLFGCHAQPEEDAVASAEDAIVSAEDAIVSAEEAVASAEDVSDSQFEMLPESDESSSNYRQSKHLLHLQLVSTYFNTFVHFTSRHQSTEHVV